MTNSPTIHDPVELRVARVRAGLNQGDLAGITGFDQSYISLLERGRRQPTGKTLKILADALGCDIDTILRKPAAPRAARKRKTAALRGAAEQDAQAAKAA
jgi:transcriptional regulator with XRE-family HTH domain